MSSAIPSRALLAPTGAQTPGARYARKRFSFLPFRITSFPTLVVFQVFEDNRGARAPEKVAVQLLYLYSKPPPLPAPQLFLKTFREFLLQLGGGDTLTCNTPSTISQNTSVTAATIRAFYILLTLKKRLLSLVLVFSKFRITLYCNQS